MYLAVKRIRDQFKQQNSEKTLISKRFRPKREEM